MHVMRKGWKLVISAVLASSLVMSNGEAFAQEITHASDPSFEEVTVIINGIKQIYPQPAILKERRSLVPLRGIFEELGAEVEWDSESRTATGTKGDLTVFVQIDHTTAYVNGEAVELDVPAQIINGSTMVPLRFVSESLGAEVEWDNDSRTVTIIHTELDQRSVTPGGIQVLYGVHDYHSKSQEEYDQVMDLIQEQIKPILDGSLDEDWEYRQQYDDFIDGKRWDQNRSNRTVENMGLYFAENAIGTLVFDGVDKDTIMKAYQAATTSSSLLAGTKAPAEASSGRRSAYDALFNGVAGNGGRIQVYSAVFDALGFNTAAISRPNHLVSSIEGRLYVDTFFIVEIEGNWYFASGSTFSKADDNLPKLGGSEYSWAITPTNGLPDSYFAIEN